MRPVHILAAFVLVPAVIGVATAGGSEVPGRSRPVWPFLLAALLLCFEWTWRQRIGLR